MRRHLTGVAVAGVLLAAPGVCVADVLGGHALGPTLAGGSASFTQGTGATAVLGAEFFTLGSSSRIERIIFNAYHRMTPAEAPAPGSIDWSIRDSDGPTPGSTSYLSGQSGFTTNEVVALGGDPNIPEFSILDYIIDIPDLLLSPGDYWVTFHVNQSSPCDPSTSTGTCDPAWSIAVDDTDGLGAGSTDSGANWSSASDFVFRIEGTVVPSPATVTLLGLGLALLGARRRALAS